MSLEEGEIFSNGENVACNGRVLCRRCNRVADNVITATVNKWQQIGIKIVEKGSHYYWGHCKSCLEKSNRPCECGCGKLVPSGLMESGHPEDYRGER